MTLQIPVALVTGGASGIGAVAARMLAAEGNHVVIVAQYAVDEASSVQNDILCAGGSTEVVACDVSDAAAVAAMVADVVGRLGRIDLLVNSAGMFHMTPAFDIDMARVEQLFSVNCFGAIAMIKAVLPVMRAAGKGAIVSVASAAGVMGGPGFAAYGASKAAIIHFTRTLAAEFGRTGIRINCVAPGSVRTQMIAFSHSPTDEAGRRRLALRDATTRSPYGTVFAEPEDIANIILFLLSDGARAVTGACVVADQGETAAVGAASAT